MRYYITDDHNNKHHVKKGTLKRVFGSPVEVVLDWWHMRKRYRVTIETNYRLEVGDEFAYSTYVDGAHRYETGLVIKIIRRDRLRWILELEYVVPKS